MYNIISTEFNEKLKFSIINLNSKYFLNSSSCVQVLGNETFELQFRRYLHTHVRHNAKVLKYSYHITIIDGSLIKVNARVY